MSQNMEPAMDTEYTNNDTETNKRPASHTVFLLVLFLIMIVMMWRQMVPVQSAVAWESDLTEAQNTAFDNGKPILISFSSPGCTYCRQMEVEVIPQKEVLAEIERYIPVKIDAWKNEAVAARYDVQGLPTYVVTDYSGRKLAQKDGYVPASEFVAFLKSASPVKKVSQ